MRLLWAAAVLGSAVLIWRWLVYLQAHVPAVSRADYLYEIWTIAPDLDAGRWLTVIAFVFHLVAGHIIAYARILEIINWVFFDYSEQVVKFYALATYALCWLSLVYAVIRTGTSNLAAAPTLVAGTVLLCLPVPWLVVTWPESIVAYFACWASFFLCMPSIAALLAQERAPGVAGWLAILLLAALVLVSVGGGWAIVPTLVVAWITGRGHLDALFARPGRWRSAVLYTLAFTVLAASLLAGFTYFSELTSRTLHMDIVYESLSTALAHPWLVLRHFLALLATPFMMASMDHQAPVGLGLLVAWAIALVLIARAGATRATTLWISASCFGLAGAAANTLGRWHLVNQFYGAEMPTHYGVFTLPFLTALVFLLVTAAAHGHSWFGRLVPLLLLVASVAVVARELPNAIQQSQRFVVSQAEWHIAARIGAQNYHSIHMARLSGDHSHYRMYVMELMPDLKRWGKYRTLTTDFIADAPAFIAEHRIDLARARLAQQVCPGGAGRVDILGPDTRGAWNPVDQPQTHLVMAIGVARDPGDCDHPAEFVFMTDRTGRALCVSRPHRYMLWDVPEATAQALAAEPDAVFQFSCPLPDGVTDAGPYQIYSWSSRDHTLTRLTIDNRTQRP